MQVVEFSKDFVEETESSIEFNDSFGFSRSFGTYLYASIGCLTSIVINIEAFYWMCIINYIKININLHCF